jgi:hypothetical protein
VPDGYFPGMSAPASPPPAALAALGLDPAAPTLAADVADAVARYEASGNVAALHRRLAELADAVPATPAGAAALAAAARPYEHVPEVAGPLYERVVARRPDDARALVVLGNAYWLHGRAPTWSATSPPGPSPPTRRTAAPGTSGRSPRPTRASACSAGSR